MGRAASRRWMVGVVAIGLAGGCATTHSETSSIPPTTQAPRAAGGGGVGAYMDAQEERLAKIPGTSVERVDKDTLLVRFNSDILFATDSASLGPTARGSLEEVAGVLARYSRTAVVVQGHTDSTGPSEYNQELSERRARSVGAALVEYGVAPARVVSDGYGESMPVASNNSERGRQLNRRVILLVRARAT